MADDITDTSQTVAAGQLRAFIERIERLEEEKKTISDDIKEVFAEAKGTGFQSPLKLVA
ncbi:GapR family DNA-binding domain-containing protein [Mesorhizobium cantuariense]|uniref:GapR family DNA-binding domain-containing protein n=1 Tax=Mesorhizobium cantuariense TaxID=1300275 RepID=A0ABV7MWV3_9HYPH